jgi:transglycosylase-like protein with SLT domain
MMRRFSIAVAAVTAAAFAAAPALAQETPPAEAAPAPPAASQTQAPAPAPGPTIAPPAPAIEEGATIAPPAPAKPQQGSGGVEAEESKPTPSAKPAPEAAPDGGTFLPPAAPFAIPYVPSPSCSPAAVPAILVPIYQRAAAAYALGPQGPAVLAAINEIETAFGTNLNISSAGAVGWMQFMPETWEAYGVDANGDGVADPYDPEDAIHAAASYLSASGFPEDTYGAIVADVLAGAACYGSLNGFASSFALTPKLQVLRCVAAKPWRKELPTEYLNAFEAAAARYNLGRDGVWALAAVARLESNFGKGMSKAQLESSGPLGLDGSEWQRYKVDGDGDGRIERANPDDSASTLARLIWSRGGLRAGLFSHNQASWYVQAVLADAERLRGNCEASEVEWALSLPEAVMAPIEWENLTILNEVAQQDLEGGAVDPRIVGLIGAITQEHTVVISSLRSDHSMYTVSGGVSNHYYGRAMDIAMVDGVSCTDTAPTSPCGELALTLSQLPEPAMPTELIYCYDVDGPGPAFARADHCDHIHAGYDG